MCGIAGYYSLRKPHRDAALALAMLRAIRHRGPDDQGMTFLNRATSRMLDCATRESAPELRGSLPLAELAGELVHEIAFVHCRYSIVDLSAGGHQPMWDAGRAACVSFNGEIYNHLELRAELERSGTAFRTGSDTEVLLAGYLRWGTEVFSRLNGQWALSLYDARDGRLLLSRDRLGKVPLYYAQCQDRFYWASEIKAILAAEGTGAFGIRAQAVHDYVAEGERDREGTFWEGIEDFPPASFAWVGVDGKLASARYWALPRTRYSSGELGEEDASRRVRDLLAEAIALRARADVPVAFELSGGMDSSAIVALAARSLQGTLTAYTVQFQGREHDESAYANAVAAHHPGRIEHRVVRPAIGDFWSEADEFVEVQEEPFHAPNLHANQRVRRQMKADGTGVIISGSAGDEVFAGYASEYLAPYLAYLAAHARPAMLLREACLNTELPLSARNAFSLSLDVLAPRFKSLLQRALSGEGALFARCYRPPAGVAGKSMPPRSFSGRMRDNMGPGKMNYWLRSANKANFAIPIEARAPFLDYRFLEFAFRLPPEYLIRDGWQKWILRKAMARLLPQEVLWRRAKMGFPFPLGEWLLRSRRNALANLRGLDCPYLDAAGLQEVYEGFARRAPLALWRLLSLGLWWRRVVLQVPIVVPRQ